MHTCHSPFTPAQVSNKIYAALLPRIGKLHVVLESKESHLAIYQLLMAMCPKTITLPVSIDCVIAPYNKSPSLGTYVCINMPVGHFLTLLCRA